MEENYPKTIQEFAEMFRSDADCYAYLAKVRWGENWACPNCKHAKLWQCKNGQRFRCAKCSKDIRVAVGTTFQDSHIPLKTWFYALWLLVFQKQGISALGLGRAVGIKRKQTSWELLMTVRQSMNQTGKDKLKGMVEVDEVFVGGIHKGKRGRGAEGKVMVLVAVEDSGVAKESKNKKAKIGRIRMQIIPDAKSETLLKFLETMVEKGSVLQTDELKSYPVLKEHGYKHKPIRKEPLKDSTPLVHRTASLLKRWLLGTHQGGVHLENMQSYLDEYVFRFNRRTSLSRGKLFLRLLQAVTSGK